MGSRFVRPNTRVLKISDGDTLTVRKRLTSGEQRAAFARMYLAGVDGKLRVNPIEGGMGMVTAYLLDWSFTDEGVPVSIRDASIEHLTSVLDGLDPESFAEIKLAIERHEEEMVAERADAKKIHDGETMPAATSPSPSAVDGA